MARLLFIGMWNFCDDRGVHPVAYKTLKAEVFPADDVTASQVEQWVGEMIEQSLLETFHDDSGRAWWHVTGWHHQRIDRPSKTRYPEPPRSAPLPSEAGSNEGGCAKDASKDAPFNGALDEHSSITRRSLDVHSLTEGKGREGIKPSEDKSSLVPDLAAVNQQDGTADEKLCLASGAEKSHAEPDDCPHVAIIALYHELLPECPPVKSWLNGRAGLLRQRWREDKKRQSLDWWRRFFSYVHESDFLAGRARTQPGRPPFVADLEWLVRPNNLAKVIEGKYHHEASA